MSQSSFCIYIVQHFKRLFLSCYDVNFNIQRAAELFSGLISSNGGNVLLAIGSYNGWYSGLTYASGTAAASRGQCSAQNNLDYIHQFCNGWMQNKGGYTLGTYCEYSFSHIAVCIIDLLALSQPQELLNVFLISGLIKLHTSRTVFYLFSCFLIFLLPDMTPRLMPGEMTVFTLSYITSAPSCKFSYLYLFFTCGKVALYPCIWFTNLFFGITPTIYCGGNCTMHWMMLP